jgi:hypothetical protein
VAGKVPTGGLDSSAQIDVAELCLNLKDEKLYSKNADGTVFEVGSKQDDTDERYLRIDADAPDQTRVAGEATFAKLTTHKEGIKVTGGGIVDIDYGLGCSKSKEELRLFANSTNTFIVKSDHLSGQTFLDGSSGAVSGIGYKQVLYTVDNDTASGQHDYIYQTIARNSSVDNKFKSISGYVVSDGSIKAPLNDVAGNTGYAFYSDVNSPVNADTYSFYASGFAPNFLKGNTYIGGSTTRNTFELWKSTLTEEQLEQLEAGTLVAPANVSTPGDGEFARQWWYDQQSTENQALIDAGELEYPEHLAAATFTDTFALGQNTNIDLLSTGEAHFAGNLGIGTEAPQTKLEVDNGTPAGTLPALGGLLVTNAGTSSSTAAMCVATGSGPVFNVMNDGNVGIGTDDPKNTLSVVSGTSDQGAIDTNNQLQISRSGSASYAGYLSYGRLVGSNNYGLSISALNNNINADILIAPKGGRVGVGTDSPATALDVNGNITVQGLKNKSALATDASGKIIAGTAGISQSNADNRYLRTDAAANAQVIQSTNPVTYTGNILLGSGAQLGTPTSQSAVFYSSNGGFRVNTQFNVGANLNGDQTRGFQFSFSHVNGDLYSAVDLICSRLGQTLTFDNAVADKDIAFFRTISNASQNTSGKYVGYRASLSEAENTGTGGVYNFLATGNAPNLFYGSLGIKIGRAPEASLHTVGTIRVDRSAGNDTQFVSLTSDSTGMWLWGNSPGENPKPLKIVNNSPEQDIKFYTKYSTSQDVKERLAINKNGVVKILNLAGNGSGYVTVTDSGNLGFSKTRTVAAGEVAVQLDSDDPASFQTSYVTEVDSDGNEYQVPEETYVGSTEDLLSIIKDLRARVAALEAAEGEGVKGTIRKKR